MSHSKPMFFLFAVLTAALFISGCTAFSAEPTPSLQELQLTAQAVAETSVAQTLAAQPTATQPPPSPTPIPPTATLEPIVMPPLEVAPQQVVVAESPVQPVVIVPPSFAEDTEEGKEQDCTGAINAGTEGPRAPVFIVNKKGASILLSYYLEPSPFGQCGSGSVSISSDSKSLNLPRGCYWLYAWVSYEGKDQSFQGYGCNPTDGATWYIYPDRIEAVQNDA